MGQTKYYNTGGGALKFTPIVDGVAGAQVDFGQTENVSFSTETETLTHDNTETCTTYEDMNILKKVTGKINIETLEISPEMLERAYLGTLTRAGTSAGSITAEPVTITTLGVPYPLSVKFVSNVIVKDDGDATTYDLNIDYTIDADKGIITAIDGGAISALDVIHVSADNSAYDDINIEGFIDSKLEGILEFESCAGNGISYTYTFHRVSLLASGDYMLKSAEEFSKLAFEGTMLASELITGDGISKLFKIAGSEKTV